MDSGRAGAPAGTPLSPDFVWGGGGGGRGGGGGEGMPWNGAGGGEQGSYGDDSLHPDVVGAYFAGQNGNRDNLPGMPSGGGGGGAEEAPPSRGAYDEARPFTPQMTAAQARAAEQGDVAGYMQGVDALAEEVSTKP